MESQPVEGQRRRRVNYKACKLCRVAGTPDAPISSRGKCGPCGERRLIRAVRSMKHKLGPDYERWVEGMVRAVEVSTGGSVVLTYMDDVESAPSRADVA